MNTAVMKKYDAGKPGVFAAMASAMAKLHQKFSDYMRYRSDIEMLNSMPDYMLKDMGLHRWQIEFAVKGEFPRRSED